MYHLYVCLHNNWIYFNWITRIYLYFQQSKATSDDPNAKDKDSVIDLTNPTTEDASVSGHSSIFFFCFSFVYNSYELNVIIGEWGPKIDNALLLIS